MKKDITRFISSCQVCSQAKLEHCKLLGLLQPLAVPPQAWYTIYLDFIEGLPKSKQYDTILVCHRQIHQVWSLYTYHTPLRCSIHSTNLHEQYIQTAWYAQDHCV